VRRAGPRRERLGLDKTNMWRIMKPGAARRGHEQPGPARALLEKYRPAGKSEIDLRGWEWRYLWPLCQSDALFTFSQHSNSIGVVAFAGNGRLLAARDLPGDVILWDIDTRQEIARWPHGPLNSGPWPFAERPVAGGGQLAPEWQAGGGVVEVTTRKCLAELPHGGDGVISLAFSPDGSVLATFGTDRILRLWSLATRQIIASFPISPLSGDFKGVVAFSPDGAPWRSAKPMGAFGS